ncbi:MAG: Fe-S oxidoreductase [Nitrospirae bacterium]|nr:MAG: Fe-S oxidoreductase [Nitrospirota bacterium]
MATVNVIDLTADKLERSAVLQETLRIFDVCDGCRRCFNLCPSFNTLFERIDAGESDLSKLQAAEYERVADECYYCKLCYNHCPYTPPHPYQLDFPRLMIGWKKLLSQDRPVPWRDRLLVRSDWIGKLGTTLAPLMNWANRTSWIRDILHRVLGIHRERQLVKFQEETFPHWLERTRGHASRGPTEPAVAKVALFSTCLIDYHESEVGQATVQVLEKNRVEVVRPEQQCCGMPFFETGNTAAILKKAVANLDALQPYVDAGYDVVVPSPSCSLMLKREYPHLLPTEQSRHVAARTFDVCEYLMKLKKEGKLNTEFTHRPGKIAYHIPCHLRDQNIGFKSKELMELTGAHVDVIERCSGHDGIWSMKTEFFDLSMKIAAKAVREVEAAQAEIVVSDCPLAGLQLSQAGGMVTVHPIQVMKRAYGI